MICDNKRTETATLLFRFLIVKRFTESTVYFIFLSFFFSLFCVKPFFFPELLSRLTNKCSPKQMESTHIFQKIQLRAAVFNHHNCVHVVAIAVHMSIAFSVELKYIAVKQQSLQQYIAFDHKFKFVENYTESIRSHFLI